MCFIVYMSAFSLFFYQWMDIQMPFPTCCEECNKSMTVQISGSKLDRKSWAICPKSAIDEPHGSSSFSGLETSRLISKLLH